MRTILEDLVRNFDRDVAENSRQIRDLLVKDRAGFCLAATHVLRSQSESRGSQYLLTTLLRANLLAKVMCDPALTQSEAVALARNAANCCDLLDVILVEYLHEAIARSGHNPQDPELQRPMELLCEISDGARIRPSLIAMSRMPNPYLQSKGKQMIRRANKSVRWVQGRLAAADSRMRANAVEGLWGVDSAMAREMLHKAASDANNRVAGNAMLGLYRMGDTSVIPLLLKMAEHPRRWSRATAAWAMGMTENPRFTRALARLVTEPIVVVRARAFKALGQIRQATAAANQAEPWQVVGRYHRSTPNGWRRMQVDVASADGKQEIRPLPTDFILSEEGQPVVDYTVAERPAPEPLSIAFVLPREESEDSLLGEHLTDALRWKRPVDLWGCVFYVPKRRELQARVLGEEFSFALEGPDLSDGSPLSYFHDPADVRAAFLKVPLRSDCTDVWNSIRRALLVEGEPAQRRHVIVFSESEGVQPPGYAEIVTAAQNAHATVHGISMGASPLLEKLCQSTLGTGQTLAEKEELPGLVRQICLNLTARYLIRYQSVCPTTEALTIRVQSSAGWGETTVSVPREESAT